MKKNNNFNYVACDRLCNLLEVVMQDEFLKEKLVLKGGVAVSAHIGKILRCFCDINFDYKQDKNISLNRYITEGKILNIMNDSNNVKMDKSKSSSKINREYILNDRYKRNDKIEINYSNRTHLYDLEKKKLKLLNGNYQMLDVVGLEELLAMKLKVLLERGAAKDLYDCFMLIVNNENINIEKVKKAFIFYSILSNPYKDILSLKKVNEITKANIRNSLGTMINTNSCPSLNTLNYKVLEFISDTLKLKDKEKLYIKMFRDGVHKPTLLFDDKETIQNALNHPFAKYKIYQINRNK